MLPRGVGAGEEAGNFWWNVTADPEAQEHAPAKYLRRKVDALPPDRLSFVTCLIHEDNWYKQGTAWDGTYFEDRGRKQPRTPPFKPEPRRMVRLRTDDEQARIWQWWEDLVAAAAGDKRIRVVTLAGLIGLVRHDDLERTYDKATVLAAARQIAAASAALPDFVVVENDSLSLGDSVQALTALLAGRKRMAVKTLLGPARPARPAEVKLSAAGVVAAAKAMPDGVLPSPVTIGGQPVALETYLYAAARVAGGETGEFTVPALRGVGPDPARWAVKPARRR